MSASAIQQPSTAPVLIAEKAKRKAGPRAISFKEFKSRYMGREDGFKYEWVDGQIEKTKKTMDKTQYYIVKNLLEVFRKMLAAGRVSGELLSEGDLFFLKNLRRPDIFWWTDEQVYRSSYGEDHVPAFVIEIISTNDQTNRVEKKMMDYRQAGVAVVWQIFPELKTVHVYSGSNLEEMRVRRGTQICSASPALPHFEVIVDAIFYRPTLD